MTRLNLDPTAAAESVKPSLRAANLFRLAFPTGTVYATNAGVAIAWNGWLFEPGATVLGWSGYTEAADLRPRGVDFSLGLAPNLISALLADGWQNALVDVWIAWLDTTWNVLGTPYAIAPGLRMSTASMSVAAGGGDLRLSTETGGIYFDRDSVALCTGATQRRRYATDTALDRLDQVLAKMVDWGGKISGAGSNGSGGGSGSGSGGGGSSGRGGTRPVSN